MAWTQIVSYTLASFSVVVCDWCGGLFDIWLQLGVLLGVFFLTILLFGLRSAPQIFSAVVDVLKWNAEFEEVSQVLHYLIMVPVGSQGGTQDVSTILNLFERLQVSVAPEKIEGPTIRDIFPRDRNGYRGLNLEAFKGQVRCFQGNDEGVATYAKSNAQQETCSPW